MSYRRSSSVRTDRSVASFTRRQLSCDSSFRGSFKRPVQHRVTPPPDAIDVEPETPPPPHEYMDRIAGFEGITFNLVDLPPPPVQQMTNENEEEPHRTPLPSPTEITESEARKALLKHVARRCCYGKAAAEDMSITKVERTCAFHYTLESFCEKRQTCWSFEPYLGGPLDGPSSGQPPDVWEIDLKPNAVFQNQLYQMEVPHTASIKMCHCCGGVGRKRCHSCNGTGWESCFSCHGDGHKPIFQGEMFERERCFYCHGSGKKRCWKCNGDGIVQCRACAGTGQIKCFIKLVVTWSNHMDDLVVDKGPVPDDQIKLVSGQVVFEEEQSRLWPINHFPDITINLASAQLVKKHLEDYFTTEKPLVQRQRVRVIPIALIHYLWKGKSGKFCVFGFERRVHAPDYPQTCCCGCVIL